MNQLLLIWAVTAYLVSLSGSLLLSFFHKKISFGFLWILFSVHLLLLLAWFFIKTPSHTLSDPGSSNYLFLLYCCSGILIAGTLIRKKVLLPIRIYLSLFLASAVLFMFNPSMVIGFIVSGNPSSIAPGTFRLYENVYLMQQQSSPGPGQTQRTYKITREMGVFHKTLIRDITLPVAPDSVHAIPLDDQTGMKIKFYMFREGNLFELDTLLYFGTNRDSSRITTRGKSGNSK